MFFWNFITKDWSDILFNKISLQMYEKEQYKKQKKFLKEKRKIVQNNRIIVNVNNSTIYDSDKNGEPSDDLYLALLSYGLKDNIKNKCNINEPISYNISRTISSIPMLQIKSVN